MVYRSGRPSLVEWQGPWKLDESESDEYFDSTAYDVESDTARESFSQYLFGTLGQQTVPGKLYSLCSDRLSDRTEYIYIRDPDVIDEKLIQVIQEWQKLDCNFKWRVLLATCDDPQTTIVVYHDCVRSGFENITDLAARLQHIRLLADKFYRDEGVGIYFPHVDDE